MTPNSNLTTTVNPTSAINLGQTHYSTQFSQEIPIQETLREKRKREARKLNTIHAPTGTRKKVMQKDLDDQNSLATPWQHPIYQSAIAGFSPQKMAPSGRNITSFVSDATTNFAAHTARVRNDETPTNSRLINNHNMTETEDQFSSVAI